MSTKIRPLNLILLVDDDDTTNYLNHRVLEKANIAREIKVLKDGEQALDYLTQACPGTNQPIYPCPDLILMDIKMPIMDGFEFLEACQEINLSLPEKTVLLMLTSSASFYDLERLKKFDMVKKHYSKSLTESDIKEIMRTYFPDHVITTQD